MWTNFRLLSGMRTNLVPGLNPGLKVSLLSGIRPIDYVVITRTGKQTLIAAGVDGNICAGKCTD